MIKMEHNEFDPNALAMMKRRPTVHQLCVGGSMHPPFRLAADLWAIPIQSMGVGDEVAFLSMYVADYVGGEVHVAVQERTMVMGLLLNVVTAIVCDCLDDDSSSHCERAVSTRLELAGDVVACVTGRRLTPFAVLVATKGGANAHRLVPSEHGTQTRFAGIQKMETPEMVSKLFQTADANEELRFALSLFRDAVAERDNRFRVARLFSVLECLAKENKTKEVGSREAVRQLLGFSREPKARELDGTRYVFEIIEVAGRLRDKLFHGVPFEASDLSEEARPVFPLLSSSHEIGDILAEYCRAGIYTLAMEE